MSTTTKPQTQRNKPSSETTKTQMQTTNNPEKKLNDDKFSIANSKLANTLIEEAKNIVGDETYEIVLQQAIVKPTQALTLQMLNIMKSPLEDLMNNLKIPETTDNKEQIEEWVKFVKRVEENMASEEFREPMRELIKVLGELLLEQVKLLKEEIYPKIKPELEEILEDINDKLKKQMDQTSANAVKAAITGAETALSTTPFGAVYKAASAITFSAIPLATGISRLMAMSANIANKVATVGNDIADPTAESIKKQKAQVNKAQELSGKLASAASGNQSGGGSNIAKDILDNVKNKLVKLQNYFSKIKPRKIHRSRKKKRKGKKRTKKKALKKSN